MKYEDFRALPPARKAAPVILLVGEERFFKEEAIREVEAALGGGADRVEMRAAARGGPEPAAILDELRTGSLFAARKLVIVRDAEHLIAAVPDPIAEYAACAAAGRAPASAVLVLDANAVDRRLKAVKEIEKSALVVEAKPLFSEPPPWARGGRPWDSPLVDWVVARARERGKRLRPEDAYRLTRLTGNDLFEIAATLEKLDLLLGKEEVAGGAGPREGGAATITEADLDAVAGRSRRDDAFVVADAIGKRDLAAALAAIDRLFRAGLEDRRGGGVITDEGTIGLIVMSRIYAKLDEIRRTRVHLAAGGPRSRDAVAAAVGVPGFLAERAIAEADRFAGMDAAAIWRELLLAELAVKGEPPGPRAALERLAIRLCGREGVRPLATPARAR